jgi:hypothetical protein
MRDPISKDARPKQFVFVLMPFKKEFDDVYEVGILEVCEKLNLHCERADKQLFEGTILERIYNQIAKADIIVSDMTGQNPNVFYETGYAHALGKRAILLTQKKEDIPFDLVHYPHVIYSNRLVDLRPELERRLQWLVDNPRDSLSRVDVRMDFFLGGVNIEEHPEIPVIADDDDEITPAPFELSIHYSGRGILNPGDIEIGIVLPEGTSMADGVSGIWIPSLESIYMLGGAPKMFPDGWHVMRFAFQLKQMSIGERFSFALRVFTELGARDYPIHLVAYSSDDLVKLRKEYRAEKSKERHRQA